MATLSAEVQTRISSKKLVHLTNQDDTTATSVNSTVLDAAATDAAAEFYETVGVALDTSDAAHVAAGVDGVLHYLHAYQGLETDNAQKIRQRWERWLERLARTQGAERRITPDSDSLYERSTVRSGTRPEEDRARWRDFVLDPLDAGDAGEP